MKKYITILVGLLAMFEMAFAQTPAGLTVGPDFVLPTCKACTTLKAIATLPTFTSGGVNSTSSYALTQIPYTPFPFTGGFGSVTLTVDDQWSGVQNFPFPVCFGTNQYTQFIIGGNGAISFDISKANQYMPWALTGVAPLPNAAFPAANNSIFVYYDIDPSLGGTFTFELLGTAPNRIFVINWNQIPMFSTACNSLLGTHQIVLYETTNIVETYIQSKPSCPTWNGGRAIHGAQDATGANAWIVPGRNNTAWAATNDAWRFTPNGTGTGGGPGGITVDYKWYDITNPSVVLSTTDSLPNVCHTSGAKTYVVKTDFYGCNYSETLFDTITISKDPPINIAVSNIIDANCFGYNDGSFDLNVTGGGQPYTITSNGNPTSNGLQAGLTANTYQILVTDASNCTNSTMVVVSEPTQLQLSVVSQTDVLCKYQNTGTVHLSASGSVPAYQYWYTGGNQQVSPNFDSMRAGNFTFNVTDSHGCLASVPATVNEPAELLNVMQIAHEATCFNLHDGSVEAIASGGIPSYQYEWNTQPMQTGATATNLEMGVYHVLVTDANGCITATQMQVEQQLCCQLFLPDAFTPNGDQKNDMFKIIERGGGVTLGEFRIYNRWGEELFSTREIKTGWNGEFKGQRQNSDTYHYIVQYQCNDKGVITQKIAKGDFILIR